MTQKFAWRDRAAVNPVLARLVELDAVKKVEGHELDRTERWVVVPDD